MLKIFKDIKRKTEGKICEYAQKDINELSRIINRPGEGEIVKIDNIKISKKFQKPNKEKLNKRREYYLKHKYFRSTIILNNKDYLIDGYTTYILAKEMKFDYITVLRETWGLNKSRKEPKRLFSKYTIKLFFSRCLKLYDK